jgi:hypothetical protein
MSKDHRFNKKDFGYEDENFGEDSFSSENKALKQAKLIKYMLKQKHKASVKRIDKRSLA